MKKNTETFAQLMKSLEPRYELRAVFDDFLTIVLCCFSPNPQTGMSHDEQLYLDTVAKYDKEIVRKVFPRLLSLLVLEMEASLHSASCHDVLGSFYEVYLYRKGASQYFTPWPICLFMAKVLIPDESLEEEPLRILDPCCGSGRMLMANAKTWGADHFHYGIDIDETCVKMTAISLFLSGVFHGEILCANALNPNDFRVSYRLSFLPFGVFRITDRNKSALWQAHNKSFSKVTMSSGREEDGSPFQNGTQLRFF